MYWLFFSLSFLFFFILRVQTILSFPFLFINPFQSGLRLFYITIRVNDKLNKQIVLSKNVKIFTSSFSMTLQHHNHEHWNSHWSVDSTIYRRYCVDVVFLLAFAHLTIFLMNEMRPFQCFGYAFADASVAVALSWLYCVNWCRNTQDRRQYYYYRKPAVMISIVQMNPMRLTIFSGFLLLLLVWLRYV